jgi:hypothetical protein
MTKNLVTQRLLGGARACCLVSNFVQNLFGFATAFELAPLSTAAQARGSFLECRVREEMDDERKETPEEARRRKRNDAKEQMRQ